MEIAYGLEIMIILSHENIRGKHMLYNIVYRFNNNRVWIARALTYHIAPNRVT